MQTTKTKKKTKKVTKIKLHELKPAKDAKGGRYTPNPGSTVTYQSVCISPR